MIDLHMHSIYSDDGQFTPEELVAQCAQAGITCMSVTDHNSVKANACAGAEAKKAGIQYIDGIEIDCVLEGVQFHVLGYGIDSASEDFARIEANVHAQEEGASRARVAALSRFGFAISEEDLAPLQDGITWTGERIAEALLAKDEIDPRLEPYRSGGARADNPYVNFYWDFCSQGKVAYVPVSFPDMANVIRILHENGGKAVLAHPGQNLSGHEYLLKKALDLGMDGIEAFSSYHTPQQADFYAAKARERNLMVTCGSDYHGKTKPAVHLGGCSVAESRLALDTLLSAL